MSVIILDGPEKAGKSTTIMALMKEFNAMNVPTEPIHWGPVSPDDRAYSETLAQHASDPTRVYLWDRGWPSEFVYGRLLNRDRRMVQDPWIGEWLHGRAVQATGLRVILTGPNYGELSELRNSSDLQVHPLEEQVLYQEYGRRFGWEIIHNEHAQRSLQTTVGIVVSKYLQLHKNAGFTPPLWAGSPHSNIVVVGERLSDQVIPGGWLPFTSRFTTMLGREFGDKAFDVSWTNASTCDPYLLLGRETIITCGKFATEWYYKHVVSIQGASEKKPARHVSIPHPSYMFRFKSEKTARQLETVRQVIASL